MPSVKPEIPDAGVPDGAFESDEGADNAAKLATSRRDARIRVDVNLVLVPVTVCNPYNQPVTGLEKEHFKLFDDKVEQTITQFSMDDEPVAVVSAAGCARVIQIFFRRPDIDGL